MLKTVSREQTLSERAQQQLEELIVSGGLKAGDRLPSEARMGQMFGVSRTVVREAVRLLSARGLVETRNGSGIYVRELGSGMIREPMNLLLRHKSISVQDIVEVRALIEVHIAGLAAMWATSEDIAAMEESIEKLRQPNLSHRECAEIDVEFHARLAVAARNPLFAIFSQSLNAVMVDPIRVVYENVASARDDALREHGSILDRVRARDGEGARQAMLESLRDAPTYWGGFPSRNLAQIPKLGRTSGSQSQKVRRSKRS
jgi:GntR family transcriptional repressor for pyruvate dehydrogenase complex